MSVIGHTESRPTVPSYRDYNRLLRNQVLLAMAIENMAAALSGPNCTAARICQQLIIEVDQFEHDVRSDDERSQP